MAFLDFSDLVRDETVRFFMHRCRRFFIRRFDQTKDLARAFVVPIFQIIHAVLSLNRQISLMSAGDRFGRQSLDVIVNVQIEMAGGMSRRQICLGLLLFATQHGHR